MTYKPYLLFTGFAAFLKYNTVVQCMAPLYYILVILKTLKIMIIGYLLALLSGAVMRALVSLEQVFA